MMMVLMMMMIWDSFCSFGLWLAWRTSPGTNQTQGGDTASAYLNMGWHPSKFCWASHSETYPFPTFLAVHFPISPVWLSLQKSDWQSRSLILNNTPVANWGLYDGIKLFYSLGTQPALPAMHTFTSGLGTSNHAPSRRLIKNNWPNFEHGSKLLCEDMDSFVALVMVKASLREDVCFGVFGGEHPSGFFHSSNI
jgi:hypothetical protein